MKTKETKTDERLYSYISPSKKIKGIFNIGDIYSVQGNTSDYLFLVLSDDYESQSVTGFILYTGTHDDDIKSIPKNEKNYVVLPKIDNINTEDNAEIFIVLSRVSNVQYKYMKNKICTMDEEFNAKLSNKYAEYLNIKVYDLEEIDAYEAKINQLKRDVQSAQKSQLYYKAKCEKIKEETDYSIAEYTKRENDQDEIIISLNDQIEKLKESLNEADETIEKLKADNAKVAELKNSNLDVLIDLNYYKGKCEAYEMVLMNKLTPTLTTKRQDNKEE